MTHQTKTDLTVYTVFSNYPGCLLEIEPETFLTMVEAAECLAERIERFYEDEEIVPTEEEEAEIGRIRDGDLTGLYILGMNHYVEEREPIDDEEARMVSLASSSSIECDLSDVEPCSYGENTFDAAGGTFLVLTDEEADEVADKGLDSYVDDCGLLGDIPADLLPYFDLESWKRDALLSDGRGHIISGYDGSEIEGEGGFFIFRTN